MSDLPEERTAPGRRTSTAADIEATEIAARRAREVPLPDVDEQTEVASLRGSAALPAEPPAEDTRIAARRAGAPASAPVSEETALSTRRVLDPAPAAPPPSRGSAPSPNAPAEIYRARPVRTAFAERTAPERHPLQPVVDTAASEQRRRRRARRRLAVGIAIVVAVVVAAGAAAVVLLTLR